MRNRRPCNVSRNRTNCLSNSWIMAWVWWNSSGFHSGISIPSVAFSGECVSLKREVCWSFNLPSEKAFMAAFTHYVLENCCGYPATPSGTFLQASRSGYGIATAAPGDWLPIRLVYMMAAAMMMAIPRMNAATTIPTAGLR